jgi:hypothetical protein
MHSVFPFTFLRTIIFVLISLAVSCLLPGVAMALKVQLNCNLGQTISDALVLHAAEPTLVLVVKGTCTDNVVITRDDVTIRKTPGAGLASIVAADANREVLRLDGARRIVVEGVVANGLTFRGGTVGILAARGSTLDVRNCVVTDNSQNGVVSSLSSSVSLDACTISDNTGNGVVAANAASLGITNSTVSNNTAVGIVAVRSSMLRVGQDLGGSLTVKPVTVSGNGSNGIAISESSAGNIIGGTITQNTFANVFVGRASSGQIGLGSNGLTGGVTITNGLGTAVGISVEGGNATIVFSTITGNPRTGIIISNGGNARIGITNNNGVFGANTISLNGGDGIGIFTGGAAYIGGNTINANTAIGINVGRGTVDVVGGNTITNNGQTGIFVASGQALVGDSGFGAPSSANTISGNGSAGPNNGGIFAFQGGSILVANATISNNTGPAVQLYEAGTIDLRGSTAVTVPAGGTTAGATALFGSTLRVRDTASIISATSDGIQASNNSAVVIRDGNTVQGNGAGSVGVNCFNTVPMTASAATLTGGNLANVTGAAGPSAGCNLFP